MSNKILVPLQFDYSVALDGLGELTDNVDDFVRNTADYKLVMFTGGADVSPELYGETSPKGLCSNSPRRDKTESQIFMRALKYGIKMTGICRGSQFINVMSGGRMMHDIQNHAGYNHLVETNRGEVFEVNSYHHQMSILPDDGYVIGWSKERRSTSYYGDRDEKVPWAGLETEILLIPRTLCCGVQWHPEWMSKETIGYKYYNDLIYRFLEMGIASFTNYYLKHTSVGA